MQAHIRPEPHNRCLLLLDQRFLPSREEYFACLNTGDIIYALQEMVVRGAPAIGVTAAWGAWLAALELQELGLDLGHNGRLKLMESLNAIASARPTAVNLNWAIRRMRDLWEASEPLKLEQLIPLWEEEAARIQAEDVAMNRLIGACGAGLLGDGDTVMTHCNAGALATAGFGTALGVIYAAVESGKRIKVITNETRPFLQGARLSAYELNKAGVPVTIACDNSAALLMQKRMVQKVITGADRIAANGDTANKIGTFGLALLAANFDIPFYIAAPSSTFDPVCPSGVDIPIEERPAREVTHLNDCQITPAGVPVYNYAFDVTPAELITGIITEKGLLMPPYPESIKRLLN